MKTGTLILIVVLSAFVLPALSAPQDTVVREFTAASGDGGDGWRAVVRGSRMSLETVRGTEYYPDLRVRRSAYAKGVEFAAQTPYGEAVLNIRSRPCRDSKGLMHEFTAVLHYRGKSVSGCGVRGAYGHAPT